MKKLAVALLFVAALSSRAFAQAPRVVFDVCFNPVHQGVIYGNEFSGVAPIFPAWTLTPSNTTINCEDVQAPVVGSVYIQGTFVHQFSHAWPHAVANVTYYFEPYSGSAVYAAGVIEQGPELFEMPVLWGAPTPGEPAMIHNLDSTSLAFRFKMQ